MRLVLSEPDTGVWLQLEGETSEEWGRLEALAASGIWTCGPGTDAVLLRLRALAGEVAPGLSNRPVGGIVNLSTPIPNEGRDVSTRRSGARTRGLRGPRQ